MKRILLAVLATLLLICVCCCNNRKTDNNSDAGLSGSAAVHTPSHLYGFIVKDDGNTGTYIAMHSFISTCDDIGVNAKLYRFKDSEGFNSCVKSAEADNCDAVLFYAPGFDVAESIRAFKAGGIATASLIDRYENADCNILMSDPELDILEYLASDSESTILIYSSEQENTAEFSKKLTESNHTNKVRFLRRTDSEYDAAASSLKDYLLNNKDVKAIYAIGSKNARAASVSAKQADKDIKVICENTTNISQAPYENNNFAYAFCPWHELAASGVHSVYKYLSGESAGDIYATVHIVTEEKYEKYEKLQKSALDWFNVG